MYYKGAYDNCFNREMVNDLCYLISSGFTYSNMLNTEQKMILNHDLQLMIENSMENIDFILLLKIYMNAYNG
ncbi:hypothetical protein [Ileibacterium valens]|jgi:hypothetical protein|uniref:hypothetical protein n=1 Tax=Ileibacterium valens TaxID=1862668 RepID=UPI0025709B72|nr:hypothetical protein [Ileibacterium valens]